MKTKLLLTVLIIATALGGCEYNFTEDFDMTPITQGKVKKIFNGGNVDCSQLGLVDPVNFQNINMTTGRNNFDQSTNLFEDEWPTGLEVEVMPNGSISWAIPAGSISINETCYKVGAAIVKGSDASNIYFYGAEGVAGDMGLVPPINNSGTASQLSNLTFCFVECKEEEPVMVVAFKGIRPGGQWVCTGGGIENSYFIGYQAFTKDNVYKLWVSGKEFGEVTPGNLTVQDFNNDGILDVKVDNVNNANFSFMEGYLFIGKADEFDTDFLNYPYKRILTEDTAVQYMIFYGPNFE